MNLDNFFKAQAILPRYTDLKNASKNLDNLIYNTVGPISLFQNNISISISGIILGGTSGEDNKILKDIAKYLKIEVELYEEKLKELGLEFDE